jgi:hypothetical protein
MDHNMYQSSNKAAKVVGNGDKGAMGSAPPGNEKVVSTATFQRLYYQHPFDIVANPGRPCVVITLSQN